MKSIDLTYIIPVTILIVSFLWFLFFGRKTKEKTETKVVNYIPLLSVISLIIGVFITSNYYENQLSIEKEKFLKLQNQNYFKESVILSNETKSQAIDSLTLLDKELKRLLNEIKKQEKITGENSNIKEKVTEKILKTSEEIGVINSYNEIIEKPKSLHKGYTTSGNTSNFSLFCPTDRTSEYIDLKIKFQDEKLIEKINCIMINVTEVRENGENWNLFSQTYKVQNGVNAFKLKNYLKGKNVSIEIGYILNSEIGKSYPRFEKITCK